MTTLFICHATEDKDSFVRPLAERLESDFTVWYDEGEIKMGDSIRAKIDEGLGKCDFGVVVLSVAFFGKHWTQNELGGLFSLESIHRKVILPIWKGLTKEQVTAFSPMLADRFAAKAESGIDNVAREIASAVNASAVTRRITGVTGKAAELSRQLKEQQESDRLSRSEEGVVLAKDAVQDLSTRFVAFSNELMKEGSPISLQVGPVGGEFGFRVASNYGISIYVVFHSFCLNDLTRSELQVDYRKRGPHYAKTDTLVLTCSFKSSFQPSKTVVWTGRNSGALNGVFQTVALADELYRVMLDYIEKASKTSRE